MAETELEILKQQLAQEKEANLALEAQNEKLKKSLVEMVLNFFFISKILYFFEFFIV